MPPRDIQASVENELQYPDGALKTAAGNGNGNDELGVDVVASSPKHQRQAFSPPDDGLDEEIAVDDDDLDNIDDIVASHQTSVKSTPTRSSRSTAPMNRSTGNLLSAFSVSKTLRYCVVVIICHTGQSFRILIPV